MMQDDSNGDTGFEFVDKKPEELLSLSEKTESISSMSSTPSLIPSPGVSLTSIPGGNLLSNVPPPSDLPSFIATNVPPTATISATSSTSSLTSSLNVVTTEPEKVEQFYPTTFSPAIPPSKGIPQGPYPNPSPPPIAQEINKGGIFEWMKDAVSTGKILSKVAEKAKSSVDSMITTLDPQMREFIYSGGDLDIIVASDKEIKVSPIREAFQSVFGKATVSGITAQPVNVAAQPVGFSAGIKAAEDRIESVYSNSKLQPIPVVAMENFLLEVGKDKWYDMGVLILSDPTKQINLQTFTQMTPVPTAVVTLAQEDTPADYPLRWSGYSVTVGSLMAGNLQVDHTQWHQALTGVSRREIILLAARTLAGLYKSAINLN